MENHVLLPLRQFIRLLVENLLGNMKDICSKITIMVLVSCILIIWFLLEILRQEKKMENS